MPRLAESAHTSSTPFVDKAILLKKLLMGQGHVQLSTVLQFQSRDERDLFMLLWDHVNYLMSRVSPYQMEREDGWFYCSNKKICEFFFWTFNEHAIKKIKRLLGNLQDQEFLEVKRENGNGADQRLIRLNYEKIEAAYHAQEQKKRQREMERRKRELGENTNLYTCGRVENLTPNQCEISPRGVENLTPRCVKSHPIHSQDPELEKREERNKVHSTDPRGVPRSRVSYFDDDDDLKDIVDEDEESPTPCGGLTKIMHSIEDFEPDEDDSGDGMDDDFEIEDEDFD